MVDQIALVSATKSAGTGTLDLTSPLITEAFSAAILIFSRASADSADDLNANFGIGFIAPDGGATTQEQAAGFAAQHGGAEAIPDCGTLHSVAECVAVPDPNNVGLTAFALAVYDSSIPGGVKINFTTCSVDVKVTAILFAGLARAYTDACVAGVAEPVGGTTDFEPDLVIFVGSDNVVNTDVPDAAPNLGFALNSGGIPQVSAYVNWDDATEPTDADGTVRSANAFAISVARVLQTGTVSAFTATGFNSTASAGSPDAHYLALKFSGAFRMACANHSVAASTGDQDFDSFGFTPDLVLGFATLLTSLDSFSDGATAGAAAYCIAGRYGSRAITAHHEEGLSGTGVWNAHTRGEDVALLLYDHQGTVVQRATWAGGTGSGGFRFNFSTASAAGTFTALGIQLIPSPPPAGTQARPATRAQPKRLRRVITAGVKRAARYGRFLKVLMRQRMLAQRARRPELPIAEAFQPIQSDPALQRGDNAMAGSVKGANASPGSDPTAEV